jgi:predicted polyphosphate/ATP-dependent NAD kinase
LKKVGIIVNPIAGMGGRVGLKGTDGAAILQSAISLGALPESPVKAMRALERLKPFRDEIQFFTCSGDMGANQVRQCGFEAHVVGIDVKGQTTGEETVKAAVALADLEVDLLLFAGGDGTARDVYAAVEENLLVLGIPAGVKMHSAVYGRNPERAGDLAGRFIRGRVAQTRAAEVMDIDEAAVRAGHVTADLYGYLTIPFEKGHVQGLKSGSPASDRYLQEAIAAHVLENMEAGVFYMIGPGTTTARIMEKLNLDHTLVGVDLICDRKLVGKDLNEAQLLESVGDNPSKIVVTPIGGQGYLFGRGNQQLSPRVIRTVGSDNVIVVATEQKIAALRGSPMIVDSGDLEVNCLMAGYVRVVTGYRSSAIYKVVC